MSEFRRSFWNHFGIDWGAFAFAFCFTFCSAFCSVLCCAFWSAICSALWLCMLLRFLALPLPLLLLQSACFALHSCSAPPIWSMNTVNKCPEHPWGQGAYGTGPRLHFCTFCTGHSLFLMIVNTPVPRGLDSWIPVLSVVVTACSLLPLTP